MRLPNTLRRMGHMTSRAEWPTLAEHLPDIRTAIDGASHIACIAHKDADADSLGSALAVTLALRNAGKRVDAIVPEPMPRGLAHLPGIDTVLVAREDVEQHHYDLVLTFDCPTLARFGDKQDIVSSAPMSIVFDHHVSNDNFGKLHVVEVTASATGQIAAALLQGLGYPITPEIADNLYAALFTDTGGFRHENTTYDALALGAELVGLGANAPLIALKSYKSRTLPQVLLTARVLDGLQHDERKTLFWSSVTSTMMDDLHADLQDAEGIIDELQSIDTMELAVLFKEVSPTLTRVSVRSRHPHDAAALCGGFGGGGHRRAAGAEIPLSLSDAREAFLAAAKQLMAKALTE